MLREEPAPLQEPVAMSPPEPTVGGGGSRAAGTRWATRAGQSLGEGGGRQSELSEIKRLTGRLRCRCGVDERAGGSLGTSWFPRRTSSKTPGCSLSEGQEIDLPEIPAILPPTLSPKGQTSSVRLRESSRAGVCKPLPSPPKFNAPRHPTPRSWSIRAPGIEKGVSDSPSLSWRGRPRLA